MAIKIRRPAFYKTSNTKNFTDRSEPRKAFWDRYEKMVTENSSVITFYGAGGVGKSALLKKIEDEIKRRDVVTHNECKYVFYSFENITNMLEVLNTFKFQLSAYGCEFPLFDTGNYYYSLKVGQDITPPKAKSMLEKIPWVQKINKSLSKTSKQMGDSTPVIKTTGKVLNATTDEDENFAEFFLRETGEAFGSLIPGIKTVTTFMSIADTLLMKYMERNNILDEDHKAVRFQLNARRQEKNPVEIYEFLPTIFALDVSDWLQATGNKLVVLLDNYESLTGATGFQTAEQLKRDSWLSGEYGLILQIPATLWIIAGRNKLRWGDELVDEHDQHLITALTPEDSNLFLKQAGVADEKLRADLVKLTEGYPIFLDLCVDVYTEYKRQHGETEPTIDEFGHKRQDVVGRIFRYLDAAGDDVAKDMIEFLGVLNGWTDELAVDIGGKVLHNFSNNTYKRVKGFSFIQSERVTNEGLDLTVFRCDNTIQSILVATVDEKLIVDTTAAVDEYFKNLFAGKETFDAKEIFYLKLWAESIVRFADDAEKLLARYQDTLDGCVNSLIEHANFDAAEEILRLFMNKIEALDETDT